MEIATKSAVVPACRVSGLCGAILVVARAHVDRRLARLPDPRDLGDDLRHVGVVGEVVGDADRLPLHLGALEDRRAGREAQRGQHEGGGGDRAGAVRRERHEPAPRDGLALEGARDVALGGVLGLGSLSGVRHERAFRFEEGRRTISPERAAGQLSRRRATRSWRGPKQRLRAGRLILGVRTRTLRDQVGEHRDRAACPPARPAARARARRGGRPRAAPGRGPRCAARGPRRSAARSPRGSPRGRAAYGPSPSGGASGATAAASRPPSERSVSASVTTRSRRRPPRRPRACG